MLFLKHCGWQERNVDWIGDDGGLQSQVWQELVASLDWSYRRGELSGKTAGRQLGRKAGMRCSKVGGRARSR